MTDATPVYSLHRGSTPLLVSMPHSGTHVPADIAADFSAAGHALADTDWLVPRLYEFVHGIGATVLCANYSRYVVDLNRPPDNASLYPGQASTGLCPDRSFAGAPLYKNGQTVPPAQVAQRTARYWQPYHDALHETLTTLRRRHGAVLLYDAHSIAARVPRLFDGRLCDLNLGTAHGASCAAVLQDTAAAVLRESAYSNVVNGRFVGGYITRHYGAPARNVHAIQMEIAQDTYMHEDATRAWREDRGPALSATVKTLLESLTAVTSTLGK